MKKTLVIMAVFALMASTASVAKAQQGYGGGRGSSRAGDSRGVSIVVPTTPAASVVAGRVLGASTFNFGSNLGLGSRSQEVTALQDRLRAEGFFSIASTGYFGPITLGAVQAYQRAHGISATGFVGPLTLARLNTSTGAVLGASADPETEAKISSVRSQLAAVITQLIVLLQAQLNSAQSGNY